jgi:acyl-CoA dehydrogenase
MLELAQWLLQHIPSEDSSRASGGIVHGDFRIDNVVFHPNEACCCKCFFIYIYQRAS